MRFVVNGGSAVWAAVARVRRVFASDGDRV